jgi:hypothetical protein
MKSRKEELHDFLMHAMYGSVEDVAADLKKHPEFLNAQGDDSRTALMQAAYMGRADIAAFLIEQGADIEVRSLLRRTALIIASEVNWDPAVTKVLLEAGADITARDALGSTAESLAAEKQKTEVAAVLRDWPAEQARRRAEKKRLKKERHEAAIRATDFSGGLKTSMPLPNSIFKKTPKP